MSPLEEALEDLAENNERAEQLWHNYVNVKNYLEGNYYQWISDNCPYFTDHGKGHIDAVKRKASALLENHLEAPEEGDLSEVDIFLLLMGILWHDVAMVSEREGHADAVDEFTDQVDELGFSSNISLRRIVETISKAHSGKRGLMKPRKPFTWEVEGVNYDIDPRSLAAILRFADEISDTQSRVSSAEIVIDQVPEENRLYWDFARTVRGCKPVLLREQIAVNIELDYEDRVRTYPCPDRFKDRGADGEISLIEYIICRLEKMNNERAYCDPEFRNYATIRKVEARITLFKDGQPCEETEEILSNGGFRRKEKYPDITLFDAFFEEHDDWKP